MKKLMPKFSRTSASLTVLVALAAPVGCVVADEADETHLDDSHVAKAEQHFWDNACLTEPAAYALQLGEVGNDRFTKATSSSGTVRYPTDGQIGAYVNREDYNSRCKDGYLLDVYGTQQAFGLTLDYYQELPTNETDCKNTSIWVSGYEYGRYVGTYLDYVNGTTLWNRFDAKGKELPSANQSPKSGTKYQLASSSYGKWANGKCSLTGLSLQLRHAAWPYGSYYPWYRLVVGGFQGGNGQIIDKARLRVTVGHHPDVPNCTANYFCNRHEGTDSPFIDTYVTTTCRGRPAVTRLVAAHSCVKPAQGQSDEAAIAAIGLFIAAVIFL